MPSKSRAQSKGIPYAGLIGATGVLLFVFGVIDLFLNVLNPANWVVGFVGLFYGPASFQFVMNLFLVPLGFFIIGIIMLILSAVGR